MGIPYLTTYLEPYAKSTILGCEVANCSTHAIGPGYRYDTLIIDGPCFAYTIYDRIIKSKPKGLHSLEIVPSYHEVGEAALRCLNELILCGLRIHKIFFDGFLPPDKQEIRLSRMENDLRTLCSSHAAQPYGLRYNSQSGPRSDAMYSRASYRALPPAPFFVPAVIETLLRSRYASMTFIVPGEADGYCAEAAREKNSRTLVLSNDSDLMIHDLGKNGAFGSLHQLKVGNLTEVNENAGAQSHCVAKTKIIEPCHVAHRFGLESLLTLAYAIKTIPSQPWFPIKEAVEYAKKTKVSQTQMNSKLSEYTTLPSTFASRYCNSMLLQNHRTSTHFRDPRLLEFILQSHEATRCIYLPILYEDPTRKSAYIPSTMIRRFVYTCTLLLRGNPKNKEVLEYARRGQQILPTTLKALSKSEMIIHASSLAGSFSTIISTFSTLNLHMTMLCRLVALKEVYKWHLDNDYPPPTRHAMATALSGKVKGLISWDDLHLHAQVEAALYSLRMVKQTLGFLLPLMTETESQNMDQRMVTALQLVDGRVKDLPDLAELMPSREELAKQVKDVDIDEVLDRLAGLLWEEVEGESGDADEKNKGGIEADVVGGASAPSGGKEVKSDKKIKKRKKKKPNQI